MRFFSTPASAGLSAMKGSLFPPSFPNERAIPAAPEVPFRALTVTSGLEAVCEQCRCPIGASEVIYIVETGGSATPVRYLHPPCHDEWDGAFGAP
jgi:hypothetical protein